MYIQSTTRKRITLSTRMLSLSLLLLVTSTGSTVSAQAYNAISVSPDYMTNPVSLVVRANTEGVKITAAQACVSVDRSKVEVIDVDYSNTPLKSATPSDPSADCDKNDIQISRYDLTNHPSGIFTLARIRVRGLATSKSAVTIDKAKSFLYDDTSSGINILSQVNNYQKLMLEKKPDSKKPALSITHQRTALIALLVLLLACFGTLFQKRRKRSAQDTDGKEI